MEKGVSHRPEDQSTQHSVSVEEGTQALTAPGGMMAGVNDVPSCQMSCRSGQSSSRERAVMSR